ncbi:MAG: sialidase family protein [Dehalogenimonas sp.]
MRPLSVTLAAAQRSPSRQPCLKAVITRRRLEWQLLYSGAEADYLHAAVFTANGTLIRARITNASDSGRLYRQRTAVPGPEADFSQWVNTGQTGAVNVAVASCGAEVSILWVSTDRGIRRITSTDDGLTWSNPELIDYLPTTAVGGLTAVYDEDHNLGVFFTDQTTLYVKRRLSGIWQPRRAWDKTTGTLTGLAGVYDEGFRLALTGRTTAGDYRLWTLTYDEAGNWGVLGELAASPAGEGYEFRNASLHGPNNYRCAWVESNSGLDPYHRVYLTSLAPGAAFDEVLWVEPEPLAMTTEYGPVVIERDDAVWLISAAQVWRAITGVAGIDVSVDIKSAVLESEPFSGSLQLELDNAGGPYDSPVFGVGDTVEFSSGCITAVGAEVSDGLTFTISAALHCRAPGESLLVLAADDYWTALKNWQTRNQLRWHATHNIKDILAWLLGRAGLRLAVISASAAVTGEYPDFMINPGGDGLSAVKRLLSDVPDVLFIEGDTAFLLHPQTDDPASYGYGQEHPIFRRRLAAGAVLSGEITVPPNFTQQLYDVVTVDGMLARVTGLRLDYRAFKGLNLMKIRL